MIMLKVMDILAEKKAIRQAVRQMKVGITNSQRQKDAVAVFSKLERLREFQTAQRIMIYWALKDELPTREFILKWCSAKSFFLPVVSGDLLELKRFVGEKEMVPGELLGIPEPEGERLEDDEVVDLVVVPGVAFDRFGNRLGRGGGYYDRVFSRLTSAFKVGVGFACQLIDQVPVEPHDEVMDVVITS